MSSLVEKFQKEITKGQAERLAHEQNLALDASVPENRGRIHRAKMFQRKVGASIALLGLGLVGATYAFYVYTGDLYLILGLLGLAALALGLYQTVVGKAVGKSK